jgi:hypothetical protein
VDLHPPLHQFRGPLVHFSEHGAEKILGQFQAGGQDKIEDFPVVLPIVGIPGQGFGIENLIEQEFQIAFAHKFFYHRRRFPLLLAVQAQAVGLKIWSHTLIICNFYYRASKMVKVILINMEIPENALDIY